MTPNITPRLLGYPLRRFVKIHTGDRDVAHLYLPQPEPGIVNIISFVNIFLLCGYFPWLRNKTHLPDFLTKLKDRRDFLQVSSSQRPKRLHLVTVTHSSGKSDHYQVRAYGRFIAAISRDTVAHSSSLLIGSCLLIC